MLSAGIFSFTLIPRRMVWPRPSTIILVSVAIGVFGVGPLLLHIMYGPKNENPMRLGLLAFFAMCACGTGILVGVVRWFIERGR